MKLSRRTWPQESSDKPFGDSGSESRAWLSRGGELLTQTEDFVGRCKEHFEELLNPTLLNPKTQGKPHPYPY